MQGENPELERSWDERDEAGGVSVSVSAQAANVSHCASCVRDARMSLGSTLYCPRTASSLIERMTEGGTDANDATQPSPPPIAAVGDEAAEANMADAAAL